MVEQRRHFLSHDPDVGEYDRSLTHDRLAPYRFGQSPQTDSYPDEVPLFLSDYGDEPDPSEYIAPLRKKRRAAISSRILASALAASALALLFALFSSDATQDVLANAKASIAAILPAPSAAAQPDPAQLAANDMQFKDPARISAPVNPTADLQSVTTVAVAPTRAEITTAYQSALQSRGAATTPLPPAAQVPAPPPAAVGEGAIPRDPIHHLDPNEIASSLRRGAALIASGDLAAARLVLRRAADAGDARSAMMLAETYDAAILEKLGVHGVVPDSAMARGWYEKAKQFGATEATQRLELLASKEH
jgi:hypothetical protein